MSETQRPGNALRALKPKTKASRFRRLLPMIAAKIGEGVGHADIIQALREDGLDLTMGTYFNYLQRCRKEATMPCRPHQPNPQPAPSLASSASSGDASARPPTFDYDPRGIPDLLK